MLSTLCSDPLCRGDAPCDAQCHAPLQPANHFSGQSDAGISPFLLPIGQMRGDAVPRASCDARCHALSQAACPAHIHFGAGGVAVQSMVCSALCNECKLSRQSVGLIELCLTMHRKQTIRCPGRLVLSSCAGDKKCHRTRRLEN